MKKILITGKNNYRYISKNLAKRVLDKYEVDAMSLRDDKWREKDFSEYDFIFHVAKIVYIKRLSIFSLLI